MREHPSNHGLKTDQRLCLKVRIKGQLIPIIRKSTRQLEPRLPSVLLASVWIPSNGISIVPGLKILVATDDLVNFVRQKRLEYGRRYLSMSSVEDSFADVVEETGNHHLLRCACVLGPSRSLKTMLKLAYGKPIKLGFKRLKESDCSIWEGSIPRFDRVKCRLPLLGSRLVHPGYWRDHMIVSILRIRDW